ncbi:MAG: type II and III secretion system protein family protein [Gemmataceae bacterium]
MHQKTMVLGPAAEDARTIAGRQYFGKSRDNRRESKTQGAKPMIFQRPAVHPRLLTLLLLTFLTLGFAQTQPTSAQAPKSLPGRAVYVPVNAAKTVNTKSGKRVATIEITKPGVIRPNVGGDLKSVVLTGLVPGITELRLTDVDGVKEVITVIVQTDIEYLKYVLRTTIPTANVIPIATANNRIILSGYVAKTEDIPLVVDVASSVAGAGNIIPALRVGGVVQVQLDVVIASVSRNEMRNMSFSFFANGNGSFLGSALNPNNTATAANLLNVSNAAASLAGSSNLLFGFTGATSSFFAFLDALRTEGLAKFLAEPRLVTMSGKPASFLSGGRLAIPEPSGLGTNAVRFEPFGTELRFLPIVLGNGKIYLEVEPVVNNVNQANGTVIGGTVVPGFDTQQLQTAVELEDGQTFALGGLIQQTVSGGTQKIPVLGDIPFLNTVFSTKSYTVAESELLILVTPHLVDPTTCAQLPKLLPGQETRTPDDFELFLEGILEAPRGQRPLCENGKYKAAYKNGPTNGVYPCIPPRGPFSKHSGGHAGCLGGDHLGGCGQPGCTGPGSSPGSLETIPTGTQPTPVSGPAGHDVTRPAVYIPDLSQSPLSDVPNGDFVGTNSSGPGNEPPLSAPVEFGTGSSRR